MGWRQSVFEGCGGLQLEVKLSFCLWNVDMEEQSAESPLATLHSGCKHSVD